MIYDIISIQYIFDKRVRVVYNYLDMNFDMKTDFIVVSYDCTMKLLRQLILDKISGVRL